MRDYTDSAFVTKIKEDIEKAEDYEVTRDAILKEYKRRLQHTKGHAPFSFALIQLEYLREILYSDTVKELVQNKQVKRDDLKTALNHILPNLDSEEGDKSSNLDNSYTDIKPIIKKAKEKFSNHIKESVNALNEILEFYIKHSKTDAKLTPLEKIRFHFRYWDKSHFYRGKYDKHENFSRLFNHIALLAPEHLQDLKNCLDPSKKEALSVKLENFIKLLYSKFLDLQDQFKQELETYRDSEISKILEYYNNEITEEECKKFIKNDLNETKLRTERIHVALHKLTLDIKKRKEEYDKQLKALKKHTHRTTEELGLRPLLTAIKKDKKKEDFFSSP